MRKTPAATFGCPDGAICHNPRMRRTCAAAVLLGALFASCGGSSAGSRTTDGVLLLEVGGSHESLRAALLAAGAAPAATAADASAAAEGPPTSAPPETAPAADHVVVALGRGETLAQLAKRHLGNAARYREILARNGWSEAEARRLPEGQLVKVPVEPSRPPVTR